EALVPAHAVLHGQQRAETRAPGMREVPHQAARAGHGEEAAAVATPRLVRADEHLLRKHRCPCPGGIEVLGGYSPGLATTRRQLEVVPPGNGRLRTLLPALAMKRTGRSTRRKRRTQYEDGHCPPEAVLTNPHASALPPPRNKPTTPRRANRRPARRHEPTCTPATARPEGSAAASNAAAQAIAAAEEQAIDLPPGTVRAQDSPGKWRSKMCRYR